MCELAYSKDELTDTMKGKLKAAFKLPTQDPSKIQMFNPDLRRKSLGISKKPGTWAPAPYTPPAIMPSAAGGAMPAEEDYTFEELVLWRPSPPQETAAEETQEAGADGEASAQTEGATTAEGSASTQATGATTPVSVDGFLCRWLREHQREGVQFLFDCCMGLRDYEGEGCILADDMGLGEMLKKTLSSAVCPSSSGCTERVSRVHRDREVHISQAECAHTAPFVFRQDAAVDHHPMDLDDSRNGWNPGSHPHNCRVPCVARDKLGERAEY